MPGYKIYSADSHVSEPGDLWLQRIDEAFRFRAPRLESRERNGRSEDFFCYEGFPPHPVSIGLGAAARGDAAAFRAAGKGYRDALAGGWDPVERLKDQDYDGVEGEVLYTTLGFRLFWLEHAGLQRACFRVYNDWLAEFCSHSPHRLVGLALISLYDIEAARAELRRASSLGHRGAMIWLSPPAGAPSYSSTVYDPFWAEAQELGLPLVLHENTGGGESRLSPSSYWNENISLGTIVRPHEVQRTLGVLILSGVLERFPGLVSLSRERHRLVTVVHRPCRSLSCSRRLLPDEALAQADRLPAAPDILHLHRRAARCREPGNYRCGPPDVLHRLSAQRLHVAAFTANR